MARTTRDTVDYFPHFSNASESDTLTILQQRFGNDGYAFWFKLLEKLASTEGHYIDCRNPVKKELLFAKCNIQGEKGITIVEMLADLEAIDLELWKQNIIWCQKFVDNITYVYQNRRREVPQKPIITDKNSVITVDKDKIGVVIPQRKEGSKGSKGRKEGIGTLKKPYGEFKNVLLTDEEYNKLKELFNNRLPEMIETLSTGIESHGYKYKSHYATILSWARKDERDNQVKTIRSGLPTQNELEAQLRERSVNL